jgi:hypothetical protein
MPTLLPNELNREQERGAADLVDDLGVLSCFAAAELDRLTRDPDTELRYVPTLKLRLESYIPQVGKEGVRSLSDSHTLMAMTLSLVDIYSSTQLKEVEKNAKDLTGCLDLIIGQRDSLRNPETKDNVKHVMRFCIALSRRLRSIGYPADINVYLRDTYSQEKDGSD